MKYLGTTSVEMDAVTKKYVDDASSKGNTAYGWGNHASAGYVKSSGVTSITIKNGTGITGGSNTATTTTGTYTIGLTTAIQTDIANGATAYGWGNHANAGYLKTHQDISGKQDKITTSNKLAASLVSGLATVATSGKYSDLSGTPTIPTMLPASDVYAWAKAATKPTYNWGEITNSGADNIAEGTSDVTDNTEILTSYASNNGFADTNGKGIVYRRDAIKMFNYIKGKLPSWSTNATKPSYSWSEIGSRPTAVSSFTNDVYYSKRDGSVYYHFLGNKLTDANTSFSGYKKIMSGTLSAYRINKAVFTMTSRHGGCTTYYIQWNQNNTLASYSFDIRAFGAQADTQNRLKFYYNNTTGVFSVWKPFGDFDETTITFITNRSNLAIADDNEYTAIPSDVGDELACPYNVANSLNTTRTIWGQNFNGSADVSGVLYNATALTLQGNFTDVWSDGTYTHPWYGLDMRNQNHGVYSLTLTDYYGMSLRTQFANISLTGDGKVGINTYAPTQTLDVNGNVNIKGTAYFTEGNHYYNGVVYTNADCMEIAAPTDSSTTAKPLYLGKRGGTHYMTLLNSGNVGIGTTAPSAKLDVNGTGVFHKTNVAVPTTLLGSILNITDTSESVEWAFGLKNYYNQNVAAGGWGIGIKLGNGGSSETNKWAGIAAVAESAWSNSTGLAIYSNAAERIRVNGSGDVGIGTTNPSSKLDVNGNIRCYVTGAAAEVGFYAKSDGYQFRAIAYTSCSWIQSGTASGGAADLHIGGWSATTMNLCKVYANSLTCTGNVTAYSSASDMRLKTITESSYDALGILNSLSTFKYKWNDQAKSIADIFKDDNEEHFGLSAQEIQKVRGYLVSKAINNEYYVLKKDELVPLLVRAIKQLTERVEELENR